jgi:hypothetical protein
VREYLASASRRRRLAAAFVLLWGIAFRAARRQQRLVKNLLRGVPVYRQLLARCPQARAVLRE